MVDFSSQANELWVGENVVFVKAPHCQHKSIQQGFFQLKELKKKKTIMDQLNFNFWLKKDLSLKLETMWI